MATKLNKVPLSKYSTFMSHPNVKKLVSKYNEDSILAWNSIITLRNDLDELNKKYTKKNKRTLFTSIDGRVKEKDSFFKKLFKDCKEKSVKQGFTEEHLCTWYSQIYDLAGFRFSCPYFDEVETAINKIIRPDLSKLGYGVELSSEGLGDKNYLDKGDPYGYRSYHFFIRVPTPVDIFGKTETMICEVQGRSELQHVWAVKSHDLMYKPKNGWHKPNISLKKDMQELSNSLRSVDHFLVKIRSQVRGNK